MNKQEIRRKLLGERRKQNEAARRKKSEAIADKLLALPEFVGARTICFYVNKQEEVDTSEAIRQSFASGKRVVVPISDMKTKTLKLSEIRSFEELALGSFEIFEPKKEFVRLVDSGIVDLFVVPGVAFDVSGHRIGFGKGYYDDLLCGVRVPIVALAFDFQVLPSVPFEQRDVKVDEIITEKRLIECK